MERRKLYCKMDVAAERKEGALLLVLNELRMERRKLYRRLEGSC